MPLPSFTPPDVVGVNEPASFFLVVDPILGLEVQDDPVVVSVWLDDQLVMEGRVPFDPEKHCNFTQFSMRIASGQHRLQAETLNGGFNIDESFNVETAAVGLLSYQNYPNSSHTQGFSWSLQEIGPEASKQIEEGRRPAILCR